LIGSAWTLLTPRQRLGAAGCLAFFVVASVIELAGLSSAMPFVSALISPAQAAQNPLIAAMSAFLGDPPFRQLVLWLGAGVALLIVTGSMAGLAAITLIEWFGVRLAAYFAERMVRETLAAPYHWFLDKQAPILSQRFLQDPMTAGLAFYPSLMEIVYNALFLVMALITVMLVLPGESMLILVALIVFSALSLIVFRPATESLATRQRAVTMDCNKIGVEAVSGIKDIKVKGREGYFTRVHNGSILAAATTRMKLNLVNRLVPVLVMLIGQLGLLSVALALFLSESDVATLTAQLTLLVLVVGRTLPAAMRLFGNVNKLSSAKPYVRALANIRREVAASGESAVQRKLPDVPEQWREIAFADVSYRYPRAERATLSGITLTLPRNRFYGIVGPSGAGKTTFVDLLLGLLEPQSGRILIDGQPLTDYSRGSWYRNVGYVSQNPFISNDTVRRNVAFGYHDERIDDERIWRALESAGLADVCRALPEGLDTLMGDRGARLSGGQLQRLSIARALYDEPKLLILDEATSALDTVTEREIQNMIAELVGRITVIAIAHRLSTVEVSDWLLLFEDGRIVGQGTYRELLGTSVLFRTLNSSLIATAEAGKVAALGEAR
jgi:ABC-type multidrug transport system fused ATPase/permease subunit